MHQSLRGSTVTNYFKFSLGGISTIVLYSFESPWASLCPCANTFCVGGVASARPRRASKRLDCRLWKRDLFHQHNRKGKIVMIKTSRYKGLAFGFVFGTLVSLWDTATCKNENIVFQIAISLSDSQRRGSITQSPRWLRRHCQWWSSSYTSSSAWSTSTFISCQYWRISITPHRRSHRFVVIASHWLLEQRLSERVADPTKLKVWKAVRSLPFGLEIPSLAQPSAEGRLGESSSWCSWYRGTLVSLTDCRWWFDSPLVRE